MNVAFRIARWQRPTSEQDAQELAREIEQYEAPAIERYNRLVRDNEMRRLEQKLLERVDAELLDPDPEFNDWRDAAAFDAGIPRNGEI